MGELRLYAIAIDEMRGMFGAAPGDRDQLRSIAVQALRTPDDHNQRGSLISRLGPIFRRPPTAPVVSATQPRPQDLEVLLAGAYVPPERTGATWRLLETLVAGRAWGATRMTLTPEALDELDFALARGGVTAAVGLRHLLSSATSVSLLPVRGLTVGWHPHDTALTMAEAYRDALPQVKTPEQQQLVTALVAWLEGFRAWARAAADSSRPAPDLVGFWAS